MKLLIFILLLSAKSFAQCENIEYKKDKFTDIETWATPMYLEKKKQKSDKNVVIISNKAVSPVMMLYSGDKKKYSIAVTLHGDRSSFNPKGLYIVFQNGEKLLFPELEIVDDYVAGSTIYFASIQLDSDEFETLISSQITDIRMGNTDTVIDEWLSQKMLENFTCLSKMKK